MIGIKEFWVQDLPTLSNYATLDCMDSFCPRIKSNPVEKNCGQHTNLSFKEWLMYLTNSLFITEIKDKILLNVNECHSDFSIFSCIFRFWCPIIPRFDVISENMKKIVNLKDAKMSTNFHDFYKQFQVLILNSFP